MAVCVRDTSPIATAFENGPFFKMNEATGTRCRAVHPLDTMNNMSDSSGSRLAPVQAASLRFRTVLHNGRKSRRECLIVTSLSPAVAASPPLGTNPR
jgi:hypothetical protein